VVSPLHVPAVNQTLNVVVDDIEEHFARANAAGAHIIRELTVASHGGSGQNTSDEMFVHVVAS